MPATPSFPAPSADSCPSCRGLVVDGLCTACGLALTGQLAGTIWWLDAEIHRLANRRHSLLADLSPLARRSEPTGAVFPAPSVDSCPACDGPVAAARCGRCGMTLDGTVGSDVWLIDSDLHRLTSQRRAVLVGLRQSTPAPAPAAAPEPDAADEPVRSADGGARRIQYLLLTLGALCLVAAVIAFGAVAWNHMNAASQGAVLGGATIAAAGAALTAHRRGLRATAEALVSVAVAGALVDIQAVHIGILPATPTWQVWAAGTAVVAVLAWAFDRTAPLVSARAAALVVAQAPLVVLAGGAGWSDATVPFALLTAQAAVVVALLGIGWGRLRPRALLAIPVVGAGVAWLAAAGASGVLAVAGFPNSPDDGFWHHSHNPWIALAVFAATGLVAVEAAVVGRRSELVRGVASVFASSIGIAATWLGLSHLGPVQPGWVVVTLAGAATVAIGAVVPARWRTAPALVGTFVAGFGTLGVLGGLGEAVSGAGWALSGTPWRAGLGDTARLLAGPSGHADFAATSVALLAPATVAAMAWWRRVARPAAGAVLAGVALTATLILPLATAAPVWVAVLLPLLLGLGALALGAERPDARVIALPLGTAGLAVAAAWATVSSVATIGALGLALGVTALLAWGGVRRSDAPAALGSLGVALASAAGLAASVAAVQGATITQGWVTVALMFTTTSFLGWWLLTEGADDPSGLLLRQMGTVLEAVGLGVHLLALVVVAGTDPTASSVVLLSGALAMAAHATRLSRRVLVWGALAEGLGFLWLRLVVAEVSTVEAYTLPLALVLLAVGAWSLHRDAERTSWDTIGPGLALALAPTVVLAVTGSDPHAVLLRTLAVAVAAAAVLLVGVGGRLQAAVTLGAVTLAVVATRQLLPAASTLPPFLVFGAIGALLVAVGATFEQRRRDLVDLKGRFEALR